MRISKNLLMAAVAMLTASSISAAAHSLTKESPTVGENFDSMWDATAQSGTLTLPQGWVIDRNLTAPRTVGAWSAASSEVLYEGGISLASNAKNGTWNFGSSSTPSDRAVGGLTTTVANGTRCISLITSLTNDATDPVSGLDISYNIEKYRNGSNPAGFEVQMYFSTDGTNWTNAGSEFRTFFEPDDQTLGEAVVPISTTPNANKRLLVDIAPGKDLYLAWNISVASGSSPNNAPGLALDDITITAQYADANQHYLYIENATGKAGLSVYSTTTDAYGQAPGMTSSMTKIVNGVTYYTWEMPAVANFDLYATAGTYNYGPVQVSTSADAYYCMSPIGLEPIADPDTYTGWVDPTRPPFVASGYYLRGEVNSWGADAAWEFSNEGSGTYVLYDKTLTGAFKVADANWSSNFNYGSNGTNIAPDMPYELMSGTDDNISCGGLTIDCKRIVLNVADGKATLLLESDDSEDGLTSLYMVGDFNNWNYMSTTGELKLDEASNLYKGRVTMKGANDGLSHWRLYQRLGGSSVWGLPTDATTSTLSGNLVKGEKGSAAIAPATYDVTFSITDGAYTFTQVESTPTVMTLNPAEVILTPANPATVKVLSLNNSLIDYNDQDFVFNDIAKAMGANGSWTKHTNLGKPLSYHWEEGDGLAADGTPGAKMLVRSEAWSHIILQEQSSLPRTNPETFRANVKQWIEYIREYCPNPNAVIILPMNWAYSSDWANFNTYNSQFVDIYKSVADEFGAVVVPVAMAYDNMYTKEGATVTGTMFSDDRHPTLKATYMAACMEYATIFGIDPTDITYTPAGISAADGQTMRQYASDAVKAYDNTVKHLNGTVDFRTALLDDFGMTYPTEGIEFTVDGGGSITPEGHFTSDGTRGTFTVTAKKGNFVKTALVTVADHLTEVTTYPAITLNADALEATEDFNAIGTEATATLPEAWRIDKQTIAPRTLGTYATALDQTTYAGGVNLPSNAKNGLWNFGADDEADRAIGGISTGVADGTRCVNIYTHLFNDGRQKLVDINLSYDIEKYRKGSNSAGFAVQLYYSYEGRNWTSAGTDFYTYLAPDSETAGYASVPGETTPVIATLPIEMGAGLDIYLAWNITVASGDDAASAMALAIDNFKVSASIPQIPVCKHYIYVDNQTTWAALGLYAYGDSELFGAWPGQAPLGEKEIEGVNYQVFGLDTEGGSYNLIFNNFNNGIQLSSEPKITADRDFYYRIDDNGYTELDDPAGVSNVTLTDLSLSYDGSSLHHAAGKINIYNATGRLVLSASGTTVDAGILAPGIYVANDGRSTLKFVKR